MLDLVPAAPVSVRAGGFMSCQGPERCSGMPCAMCESEHRLRGHNYCCVLGPGCLPHTGYNKFRVSPGHHHALGSRALDLGPLAGPWSLFPWVATGLRGSEGGSSVSPGTHSVLSDSGGWEVAKELFLVGSPSLVSLRAGLALPRRSGPLVLVLVLALGAADRGHPHGPALGTHHPTSAWVPMRLPPACL